MNALANVQVVIVWLISLAGLAFAVFTFVDAARHRADAYPATSNQTKPVWLGITGGAVLFTFISLPNAFGPLSFFFLLAVVAGGVYMTRVRPAVRAITGRGGGSSSGW